MKGRIIAGLKVIGFLFVVMGLSFIGEVWSAASYLPWYVLAGSGAVVFLAIGISLLSLYSGRQEDERRKRYLVVELEFKFGRDVCVFFEKHNMDSFTAKEDFIVQAVCKEISEIERLEQEKETDLE